MILLSSATEYSKQTKQNPMRTNQEVIRTNATPYTILGQYLTADLLVVNKFKVIFFATNPNGL
jgi:hypothetical protein